MRRQPISAQRLRELLEDAQWQHLMTEAADGLACALARRFEGLRLRPYLCPAGIASVGFGNTFYSDGRVVKLSDPPISVETAEWLLLNTMRGIYLPGALRACPTADTPRRQAALADFAFNLGLTRLKASTLRKRVLARDWEGARTELAKWVRGGGRVLPGLVARRAEEARLL